MINNFSLYLALRYLRPKRTFVSVITVISVLGVTFGVAALLVVISVMRGFHSQIHELAASFETHIETFDRFGSSMMPSKERPKDVQEKSWRDVLKAIEATPGVTSATPIPSTGTSTSSSSSAATTCSSAPTPARGAATTS